MKLNLEYDEDIIETVNNIFAGMMVGEIRDDKILIATKKTHLREIASVFMNMFPDNIFANEYAIFYAMKQAGINVYTNKAIDVAVENNKDLIYNSPYIDLDVLYNIKSLKMEITEDEKIEAFKEDLKKKNKVLSNMVVDIDTFNSSCELYKLWFKEKYMMALVHAMAQAMSDTGYMDIKTNNRRMLYKGQNGADELYREYYPVIRQLDGDDAIEVKEIDEDWLQEEAKKDELASKDRILDWGIPEIDNTVGAMCRGWVVGILGMMKGGKTRCANYLVARALSKGLDVVVWLLEGGDNAWLNIQYSNYVYNNTGKYIPDEDIVQGRVRNLADINDIKAAKVAIATDPNRGRIRFIKGTAYVEDFCDIILAEHKRKPFDVLVIDPLIDISSKNKKGDLYQPSARAYKLVADLVTNKIKVRSPLVITPAQLRREVIDELLKNPDAKIEVTGTAYSGEVIKKADLAVGLFSTEEERNAEMMKMQCVAYRHGRYFPVFYSGCKLGISHFFSNPELNKA